VESSAVTGGIKCSQVRKGRPHINGVVAQLEEHLHGMQKVVGSSPIFSTLLMVLHRGDSNHAGQL
jgi:hypothetical protein